MAKLIQCGIDDTYTTIKDRFTEVEENMKGYYNEKTEVLKLEYDNKIDESLQKSNHYTDQVEIKMHDIEEQINFTIKSMKRKGLEDKVDYYFDRIRSYVVILLILASITVFTWIATLNIPVLIIHTIAFLLVVYDISLAWDKYKLYKSILDDIDK